MRGVIVVRGRGGRGRRVAERRLFTAAAVTASTVAGAWFASRATPARADTYIWQVGTNGGDIGGNDFYVAGNYNASSNWLDSNTSSPGVPGPNDSAYISDATTALINPGDALATGSVYVGAVGFGAAYGYLQQSGGTFNVSTYLGIQSGGSPNNQASEYDITGGTLNSTGSFIQLLGSYNVQDSAVMRIGGTATVNAVGTDNGAGGGASLAVGDLGGYGHLYLSGTATLNTKYLAYVGVGSTGSNGSIGIMDMSGGTFNMGSGLRVGAYGATGTLNMTGGTVTQSNASSPSYLGYLSSTGTWNVSGKSTVTMADELQVGGSDTSGAYPGPG